MYRLYDSSSNSFPAYCDFKSEPGFAWTLVMSWANKNRAWSAFWSTPFNKNAPVNENSLIWNMYRLSLTRMRSLQAHSTHWRATCSYPTHGTLVCNSPYASGKGLKASSCTQTAVHPAVTSTRGPAQCQVKITLVIMEPSTPSSVAQRGIIPPPSGGLVPICKRQWRAPKGLQNDRKQLSAHKY